MSIRDYLSELEHRLAETVGARLIGAWLVGSSALGDFDRSRSDIDVQAVCATRVERTTLEQLARRLSHEALPCPVRGLEFVLYAQADLDDPRGPAFQLNLNSGPGMTHHAGFDPSAEARFWFVLDVAIARDHARPLLGPHPREILPALPRPLVLQALTDALAWYGAHDNAEALLAATRAWAWAADGRWLSKGDAAAWARRRLADPGIVAARCAQGLR
jgi:hypothetical protein